LLYLVVNDVEFSEEPLPFITNYHFCHSTHDSELETPPIEVTKKIVAPKKQQGHQDPSKEKQKKKKKMQKEEVIEVSSVEVIDLTEDIDTLPREARPHTAAAKTGTAAATTTTSHTKDKGKGQGSDLQPQSESSQDDEKDQDYGASKNKVKKTYQGRHKPSRALAYRCSRELNDRDLRESISDEMTSDLSEADGDAAAAAKVIRFSELVDGILFSSCFFLEVYTFSRSPTTSCHPRPSG